MSDLYANPKYYEIAFSFCDITKEVDVFQKCIAQYSKIPVKSVLELGCGNSPHLLELLKRGYRYTGIDLSREMLEFSKSKVSEEMLGKATFLQANMNDHFTWFYLCQNNSRTVISL
ncbi:class I SAM-dependent methyltransferase [candidate division TA06 bacterium]|uniref:Class I SAM-dependent methyltransferase n=1 Tax=candidate division TA06 bacterium TaxID=2250710 RepID=A0A933ID67_UNCT6|nr:class I SAM-dependent methyltransferase [candidate division TA06 bacterium]